MTAETDLPTAPAGRDPGFAPAASSAVARGAVGRRGWRAAALGGAIAALAVPVLTACGPRSGSPVASGASISAACTNIGAALSDGPDPGADPVGYAEAQIKPLRAIQTSDQPLATAIRDLAAAYARVFASNGTSAAASKAVTAAAGKVNAICPGAAS
jgi:hypothetical protein